MNSFVWTDEKRSVERSMGQGRGAGVIMRCWGTEDSWHWLGVQVSGDAEARMLF